MSYLPCKVQVDTDCSNQFNKTGPRDDYNKRLMLGLTKVEGGTVFHEDSYIDESIIFDISMVS